jgi:putative tricarboxylic transport membrane protein
VLKRPGAEARAEVRWGDLGRAMSCWAAFVACIALMPVLGFPIAFALLTWFIVAVMARRPQRIALGVAIGGSILFYLIFELALDLSLPKGMLY